jgi:prepilin-type N-terminal cleavage/methylation domain-containing protein
MLRGKHNVRRLLLRAGGFTLVEILMVVLILGIASAIIIPGLGSRDDLRCAAASRVVMSDLIYAQNRAIALQKKHYVRFSGQQYSVSDSTALLPIDHPLKPAQSSGKYVITFGAGGTNGLERCSINSVAFQGKTIIGFNDLGEPFAYDGVTETPLTQAGTVKVQSGTYTLTIQIEPFTGDATVQ